MMMMIIIIFSFLISLGSFSTRCNYDNQNCVDNDYDDHYYDDDHHYDEYRYGFHRHDDGHRTHTIIMMIIMMMMTTVIMIT